MKKKEKINLENIGTSKSAEVCPHCQGRNFVKRGTRKNKLEIVQLYLCKNPECEKTFIAKEVKGKHFPLNIIIEALNYYNLGFNLLQTCSIIKQKFNVAPNTETLSKWIDEYKSLCRYERLRPYALKMFNPVDVVETVTMAHRQLYRFRYHRAKTILMLEEFGNRYFGPLKEYLDNISSETPHQFFQDGARMSEIKSKFDKSDMIVKSKTNYANRIAGFVLQAVKDNKQRHEALQKFMIANDSCTVATEVPVYIRKEDVEHMENVLKFKITDNLEQDCEQKEKLQGSGNIGSGKSGADVDGGVESHIILKGSKKLQKFPRLLTGHIDFIQIRNRQIHLLDYKPNAIKEKPIEQLTWYALAMSRLTGLRLFEFKCGWFDDKNYFEFYPLHVVKKISSRKKRKINYRSGITADISKENVLKIV